jgi:ribonucleoside-triphosphate reductase
LINLRLSRKVGRLGETEYPDFEVQGFNPCAEQSLSNFETCCLAEVFLPNVTCLEEFLDILELLYRVCKHSLMLPSHHPETEAIVHKNMRMGIGLTGVLQASKEQRGWADEGYRFLRELDAKYSDSRGMNRSIKLTTVKPSGTLSLLPGVTPGAHPGYARYMYRRIRIAADHSLARVCRDSGYSVEYVKQFDGSDDRNTVVVTFPFSYPEGTTLAHDMTAMDQLNVIKELQTTWSDNSVSCTIYYKKEELPEIRKYLESNYRHSHKTLSFLLHSEHGFVQAPLEEITQEQYDELVKQTTPITSLTGGVDGLDSSAECTTGACPIR